MNKRQQRKSKRRPSMGMSPSKKLVHYAQRVAAEGLNGVAGHKLITTVNGCLERKDDASLVRAQENLADEPFNRLRLVTHTQATTFHGVVEGDGPGLTAELFAIPIIMGLSGDEKSLVPQAIDDVDWVLGALRASGLSMAATGDICLAILPRLWSQQELARLSFSQVSQTALEMAMAMEISDVRESRFSISKISPEHVTIPPDSGGVYLRFLIGGCIYPEDKDFPFTREENESKVEACMDRLSELLSEKLGGPVRTFPPENFYEAIDNGIQHYRMGQLYRDVSMGLDEAGIQPEHVVTYISLHGEDGAIVDIRLAGYPADGSDEAIFQHVWDLADYENAFELLDQLTACLMANDIHQWHIDEDIHPDLRCECCDSKVFPCPQGVCDPHKMVTVPQSTQLH